ncbi:M23 family metallopeptidase [Anaerosacchariphilus polymeriproducens]|uniref:M23 family peptidase n=1 Tax=Anaerosacchariphilus polymeriproducens TaxID=1812858 RepID=A0A371AVB3_9FIRM|nr:M23 family metallopeptidase [Anaerosacchariphilus polymeriproducens]RDU23472.1 M23 family peptidase [Anaerosacchariphilus polymeriproducens]
MRRRQAGNYRGNAAYIIGGLAVCAIVGMLGLYIYQSQQAPPKPDVVDLNEVADAKPKIPKANTDETKKNESNDTKTSLINEQDKKDETKKKNSDKTGFSDMDVPDSEQAKDSKPEKTAPEKQEPKKAEPEKTEPEIQETSASVTNVSFPKGETLMWPVSGNVLMNYSMDGTIYFATLDQYKYNPAIIIQSSVNTKVLSATDGIVNSIINDEETGLTMTIDLGSGYKAVYGQLKENQVKEGDYVEKGEVLGFINEPTKYYSKEGTNLYFKLLKDDQPINPVDYFE